LDSAESCPWARVACVIPSTNNVAASNLFMKFPLKIVVSAGLASLLR
jgi:hypothetical protein